MSDEAVHDAQFFGQDYAHNLQVKAEQYTVAKQV
jgi:hypothetical protein